MKITDYFVVGGTDLETFSNSVAKHIANGYQPYGSMVIDSSNEAADVFFQPMVKKE